MSTISVREHAGFDDVVLARAWDGVMAGCDSDVIFMTRPWQRAWWKTYRRRRLLLLAAYRDDAIVAIAPMFVDGNMAFFVGAGGSDYLDFVGDVSDDAVLDALLEHARACIDGFVGFRFHHVLDTSRTGELLRGAAPRMGMEIFDEGSHPAPYLDLRDESAALDAMNKDSLRRRERYFERAGVLEVASMRAADEVLPHLDELFAQHIERWSGTSHPSLFLEEINRDFFRELAHELGNAGLLRFMRITLDGNAIALHFGFSYRDEFFWYKPTFDVALAKRSPGELLLRRLIAQAIDERATRFDFGLGDEAFKHRFATHTRTVRTWGLYPR